jgi:hypothetical protein
MHGNRLMTPYRLDEVAPSAAAAAAGLKCVACDTAAGGFDLNPDHLSRLVDADTLAVLLTHYGGVLTDVERVPAIATAIAPDVKIIEDAAQAPRGGDGAWVSSAISAYSASAPERDLPSTKAARWLQAIRRSWLTCERSPPS